MRLRAADVLPDTTFVLVILRGDEVAVEKARALGADLVHQRVSAMTLFKLYNGIDQSHQLADERETVEDVLATKPVQPADSAVIRKSGRRAGELANEGTSAGDGDVVIGAAAEVVEEPALTKNVDDFELLCVDVEPY